jgi:hypothetical protein
MDHRLYVDADAAGRFRIDKLVPGQRYHAKAYQAPWSVNETVFENLVLRAGEVRDLGDIRTKPTVDAEPGTKPRN